MIFQTFLDHQSIWPMDDWALGRLGPPPVDLAQPVGRFSPPDLFWLCYLFIFPAIGLSIIIPGADLGIFKGGGFWARILRRGGLGSRSVGIFIY